MHVKFMLAIIVISCLRHAIVLAGDRRDLRRFIFNLYVPVAVVLV